MTVVATPNGHCAFEGWYDSYGTLVSTNAEYTFTVVESIILIARFAANYNGHDYVDLGLSVKWATCNVGATKPEEYGGYYAWGETEEKENYSWETYKLCNVSYDTVYDTMTKYCTSATYGIVDNKTVLDLEDDVAHVKWGGSWRMPTSADLNELRNSCTWTWTTQNGVDGYKVTGPNGNSIFLPAAGLRDGTGLNSSGSGGHYWSSSSYESGGNSACDSACDLHFYSNDDYDIFISSRYYGQSVRPVSK